jgi:hypothetical protein
LFITRQKSLGDDCSAVPQEIVVGCLQIVGIASDLNPPAYRRSFFSASPSGNRFEGSFNAAPRGNSTNQLAAAKNPVRFRLLATINLQARAYPTLALAPDNDRWPLEIPHPRRREESPSQAQAAPSG